MTRADDVRRWTRDADEYTAWLVCGDETNNKDEFVLAADHDRRMAAKDTRIAELERRERERFASMHRVQESCDCEACRDAKSLARELAERTRERDEARGLLDDARESWDHQNDLKNEAESDFAALRAEHEDLKAAMFAIDDALVDAGALPVGDGVSRADAIRRLSEDYANEQQTLTLTGKALAAAEADARALREALREFGQHKASCCGPDCTCGLAALAQATPKEPR